MATTVAAMKARLGNTDYYVLTLKARDLTSLVKIPKKLKGWDHMSVEERYQRDINFNRVRTQIAPYLANNESRFFGAIIVAAYDFEDNIEFEPLGDVLKRELPRRYEMDAKSIGFLNLRGGETLVALDGQHRLKAIDFALTGKDQKDVDIPNIEPCSDLAQDDVTVILVPYDVEKARRIFTRVNRYAKPTTTGQNIVTDDDDVVAVLAREVANKIDGRLVKYTSNTLRKNDPEFTTLSIIYNCTEKILEACFGRKIDKARLPPAEVEKAYREEVTGTWEIVLKGIDAFADALADKDVSGDRKRIEIRREDLRGKPVVQECLVRSFVRLTGDPTNMSATEACEKLNELPWSISEANVRDVWQRVLWLGGSEDGRVITNRRELSTNVIAYMAGEKFDMQERKELLEELRRQFPEGERDDVNLPHL